MTKAGYRLLIAALVVMLGGSWAIQASSATDAPHRNASVLPSAIGYDGRVTLPNGPYDLRFRLFDAQLGGNLVGSPTSQVRKNVKVQSSTFRVVLDFGTGTFNGQRRWLEIAHRPGGTSGAFTVIPGRFEVRPHAYALFANRADSASYATQAGSAYNADYLGGYSPASFYKGSSSTQFTESNALGVGGSEDVTTYGWSADQFMVWNVKPTTDGARLRLQVEVEYHSSDNTVTYHLIVTNTGSVPSTFQLIYHIFNL